MKKRIIALSLLSLFSFALSSCDISSSENKTNSNTSSSINVDSNTNVPVTNTPNITSVTKEMPESITNTQKTDDEKMKEVHEKANDAIASLSYKNFTVKIGNDTYLIDGYNCVKNGVIYESNSNGYNVYTLDDADKQTYIMTETLYNAFARIEVGDWSNIFSFAEDISVNRVDTEFAYVTEKESSLEFKLTYTENGFNFVNNNALIELSNIRTTEVNIPTNIAKEEEYIIKDGKYNLTNLKAALTDWMNGNNAENDNICYNLCYRNLEDIKLINVSENGVDFCSTTVNKSNKVIFTKFSFTSDEINNINNLSNLSMDDFCEMLYNTTASDIIYTGYFTIDTADTKESVCRRAESVLKKDVIDTKVILAYETKKLSSDITYGDGLTYKMACFCEDGNYYEYVVNTLGKSYVENNITNKFDVEQKTKISVLKENFDLYKE